MASGKTLQSTIEISGVLSPSLQAAIKSAVGKLEEMSAETLASAGAAEKLCAEISTQESVLKSLQKGYADYVVSGKESSDEAQTLADKIQALSGELDENRGTLQAAEKAAQRLAGTQDDTADAYTKLERKISSQEDELSALRRQYANVAIEQGESSDEARQLASRIDDLSGELNENRQKLKNADQAAESFGKSLEEAGEKAESSSEGYTILKNIIANLATEAISKAVEAFKELATEGDTALATLEAKTGATGEKMAGFEDVMYEVYNANYGESLGDVQEKLSTVIQMTDDLDNASLAKVTKSAIALEDVFGFDVTESMRAVNSLMDQFGISSDEAFNLIVQGAQNGLNQNDDLLDTINEYSVQFKGAGYSADDMFNMLANGAESGTWSVDKLGDAVKEFNIRMSDGTANDYLEQLGVDVDAVMTQFNKGGPDAQKAIGTVMDAILKCDDATLQYQAGVGLFGTMWEDLGAETVASLMDTEGAIKSTSDAMAKMDSAAYDTLESSLSQLGRTVKSEVVQPIADKLIPVIKDSVNTVNEKVGPAVDWLLDNLPYVGIALGSVGAVIAAMKWGSIVSGVGKAIGAFKGIGTALTTIPGPVLAVIAVVAALAAGFAYMWKNNEDFRENMTALWEQLQGVFSELGGVIGNTLSQLAPLISQVATTVLEAFGQIAATVIPILMQLVIELFPVITSLLEMLLPACVQFAEAVLPVLVSVIQQLLPPILEIVQMVLPMLVQLIQTLLPIVLQVVESVLPVLLQLSMALLPVIMEIISAVLPILVEILNMLTPLLSMIISLLQPILDLFVAIVAPILNLILTAITPLLDILLTLISSVLKPILPIITAVGKVLTAVLGNAIKSVQPLIEGLTRVFQGLIDFVSGVFSGNWSKAWDGIKNVFGGVWDAIVGVFKGWVNSFKTMADTVLGWFGSSWEEAWGKVKDFFAGIWDGITSFFSKAMSGIKNTFTNVWNSITSFLSGAWETIKNVVKVGIMLVGSIISGAFQIITLPFRFIWENCKDTIMAAWNAIKSAVTTAINAVKSVITTVMNAIRSFVSGVWNGIKSVTSSVWNSIKNVISTVWNAISAKVAAVINAVKSVISTAWNAIKSVTSNVWNGIKSAISSVWNSIKSAVSAAANAVKSVVSSVWNGIKSVTSSVWNGIKSAVSNVWSGIKSSISNAVNGVKSTVSGVWNSIKSVTSSVWNGIKNAILTPIEAAKSKIKGIVDSIKGFFSNMKLNLPKIKLPHFKVTGELSLNPPSVPKLSIDWYKDGGIMTRPTIFGAAGNTLMAGGEAGAEAILPLAVLWEKMEAILQRILSGQSSTGEPSGEGLTSKAGELLTLDDFSLGSLSDGTNVVIYYDFSNFTWSPQFQTDGTGDGEDDLMARLRAHEAEFFDWLEEFIQMREVAQYA